MHRSGLVHMCAMTHSDMCHDSFRCAPWRIERCGMIDAYEWCIAGVCLVPEGIHTIHNHTYRFVNVHTCVYVSLEIHVYTNIFTHTHIYVYMHTYVLKCVAVCQLSYIVVYCTVQCVAVCCSVLQCVAVCCRVCSIDLQCVVVCCIVMQYVLHLLDVCCSVCCCVFEWVA